MAKEIIWSDDYDFAYGTKAEFLSEEDFINEVISQYDDGPIQVVDIKTQTCFCSETTLEGGRLIPLQHVDFVIENYYVGTIEVVKDEGQER